MTIAQRLRPLLGLLLLTACRWPEADRERNAAIETAASAHADTICLTSAQMDRESAQTLADVADLMAKEPGPKDDSTLAAIAGARLARTRGCVE